MLCYTARNNNTNHTPFILPVYYPRQEHSVHLQTGGSRGQNELNACLVWHQPLEALKPVEFLPSFTVHGEESDDSAGQEKKQTSKTFYVPSLFLFCPLMSPPPSQRGPHFTTACLRKTFLVIHCSLFFGFSPEK